MSERSAGPPADDADVILERGMRFEGLLVLPRAARIDGHVGGEVQAGAAVAIGANGAVEAHLEASVVTIEGRVAGDVHARESITLGAGAVVEGDLVAPRLAMAEGARVNGRCICGAPPEARAGSASEPDPGPEAPDPRPSAP